jgi:hypothetical protein
VSRRGSFIDGTCLSRWDGNYWHWNVAPRAHPGQREIGTSPTPFPICTGPTWRLRGGGTRSPRPRPPGRGGDRGRSTRPPLGWSQPRVGVVAAGPAGPRARRATRRSMGRIGGSEPGPRGPGSEAAAGAGMGPAAAPRASVAGRRRPPPQWSRGGRPGIRAGPTGPDMLSGEARAASRVKPRRRRRALAERSEDCHRHGGRGEGAGDPSRAHGAPRSGAAKHGPRAGDTPRRRRRALAERSVDGPARGPRRPEQARGTVLQGISAEGQKKYWEGQGC